MYKRIISLSIFACFALASNSLGADSAKEIVEKAIVAHGGADNLKKYSAGKITSKGTLYIFNQESPVVIERSFQLPDKLKEVVKMEIMCQKVNVVQIYNAGKMKQMSNDMDTPTSDDEKEEMQETLHVESVQNLVGLLDKTYELSVLDKADKVGHKEVVGLLVKKKACQDLKLFFDKKTGLLVKIERKGRGPKGDKVDEEIVHLEFKKYDGILRPSKLEVRMDGKVLLEEETTEYKHLEKMDKKEFDISE